MSKGAIMFGRAALLGLLLLMMGCGSDETAFQSRWSEEVERVWVGPDYWANPMQDWRVTGGRLENIAAGGDRNVFLLTREISDQPGDLSMSVTFGRIEEDTAPLEQGFVGFRFGIRGAFHDYRDSAVRGYGTNAGMASDGRLFIGRLGSDAPSVPAPFQNIELRLRAEPAGTAYRVVLEANKDGAKVAEVARDDIQPAWMIGGVALVSSSGEIADTPPANIEVIDPGFDAKAGTQRGGTLRFWFRDWTVSGSKLTAHPERTFGPILFAMHTLSRQVLKLTAQMAPVGNAPRDVLLEVQRGDAQAWEQIASTTIDAQARTASFRVANWGDTSDTPYRVVYAMPDESGEARTYHYEGTIRKDPADKPQIVVAAFTGNNDLGFPHADIVEHVSHFEPDLLAYTGDNIYERVGEYGIQREPVETAILDYLRKWYLFGWEYSELLKDIPAIAIPDDHDVYHGNVWGAGGRHADAYGQPGQDQGGYTMHADFVNVVQRTQTSNLPDPHDPTPVEQGISVYYTDLLYGGLSVAVIEDRKWKSAPKQAVPMADIVNGWAQNPRYDAAQHGDVRGAVLLGERQLEFLDDWASDWGGGAWMKTVVSQTIFNDVVTLPKGTTSDSVTPKLRVMEPGEYAEGEAPVQDHDSNSWPQTPRNNALRVMRKAFAFHIAGDQHLGSTIQYGIDEWNDAGWAICVPSVANVFPRRWFPPSPGKNHREGQPAYTGEYLDGFGNKMTVHAVSNPTAVGIEPTAINHRAPGYGIITFDRESREITVANWPRWVNPAQPNAQPYAGWPITIDQLDNGFPNDGLSLPEIEAEVDDPVVQVVEQSSGEIVYTIRIEGRSFIPKVRRPGVYTVRVTEASQGYDQVLTDQRAAR